MGDKRGLRKKVFVSQTIQGVVMKRFAMYWIGYHLAIWHVSLLHGYIRQYLMLDRASGGGIPFWEYYTGFFAANIGLVLLAVAVCPILLWDTMKVTHRIAGPVVRFKNVLKQMSQGERVERVRLREGDLMGDLEASFNEYLASQSQPASASKETESNDSESQKLEEVAELIEAEDREPATV